MIIDTSALIAILRVEEGAARCAAAIESEENCRISSATYVEAGVVVDALRDPIVSRKLDEVLHTSQVVVEPVTAEQAKIARQAYRDFGRGSGHPARLNLGDCFAYALAKVYNEPLLFVGKDFSHTDVRAAL